MKISYQTIAKVIENSFKKHNTTSDCFYSSEKKNSFLSRIVIGEKTSTVLESSLDLDPDFFMKDIGLNRFVINKKGIKDFLQNFELRVKDSLLKNLLEELKDYLPKVEQSFSQEDVAEKTTDFLATEPVRVEDQQFLSESLMTGSSMSLVSVTNQERELETSDDNLTDFQENDERFSIHSFE